MASASEYTNKSTVMFAGPCVVKSVHLAGDGENADCQVYDGRGTNGTFKAHLEVKNGTSYTWRPGDGTDLEQGIYIVVSGSGAKVTVTFDPSARKAAL